MIYRKRFYCFNDHFVVPENENEIRKGFVSHSRLFFVMTKRPFQRPLTFYYRAFFPFNRPFFYGLLALNLQE